MEWDELQRAMVIFAHPDDAEFGSAGTVARLAADRKAVTYVVVTDGSKGSSDPSLTTQALIEMRQREQRAAGAVLGVESFEFLGFPDGMLEPTMEVRRAITAAIRRHKPDLIIAQNPVRDLSLGVFVQHPDHLAAAEATFAAVYPCARDRLTFPELLDEGLEPHAVKELWVVGTPNPDHFIDISSTLEQKTEALIAHKSQVDPERIRKMIPERAKTLGEAHDMPYAEAYRRIQIP